MRTPTLPPLIYVLHSGNLYGTEQMALATLQGLRQQFEPVLIAPPGPVHAAAGQLGLTALCFGSIWQLAAHLATAMRAHPHPRVVATGVSHSLVAHVLSVVLRRPLVHLHVVHGGTDERLSYGRKALMSRLPVTLVAVSAFVAQRLLAHGCRAGRITVVENFLTRRDIRKRQPFANGGIHRVAMVSRTDPIKRVGLLFDALDRQPGLAALQVDIFGQGSETEALRVRAARYPGVRMHGFVPTVAHLLADYDLLLHTCAEEPFGLAVLEAMAAGVPVLVPNAGGAGSLVTHTVSGFHFAANDATHLAQVLSGLRTASAAQLNTAVGGAHRALTSRFAPERGLVHYHNLLEAHDAA